MQQCISWMCLTFTNCICIEHVFSFVEMCRMVPDWAPAPAPSSFHGKGERMLKKKKKDSSTENANLLKIQQINKYKKTLIQENYYSHDSPEYMTAAACWKKERTALSFAWNERVSSAEPKRCFDNKWRRINDHKNKSERTKHKTSGGKWWKATNRNRTAFTLLSSSGTGPDR